jgi:hypothetical protein
LRPLEIARRRLANQGLIGPPFAAPVDVVRTLGAVQAQDYAGAKWGIALRTANATDADVERALTDGAIVRTHVLRPTWHFVAAEDIRWMLKLTAPRVRAQMASYDRRLELDDKVYARSNALITKALAGGKHLTRLELRDALARGRIEASTQRLGHLMMRAELDGVVCNGVRRGKQATYALVEERLPRARELSRDEALAELATRYFTTRGPATVQDFSWWSGLSAADARHAIELVKSAFDDDSVDGRTYWFTGDRPTKNIRGIAHLLPNYDEYFIGLKDRSAIQQLVKERVVALPGDSFFANLIMLDGQLAGGWTRVVGAKAVRLQLHLEVRIAARHQRALEKQARRHSEFLGLPVAIAYGRRARARRPIS